MERTASINYLKVLSPEEARADFESIGEGSLIRVFDDDFLVVRKMTGSFFETARFEVIKLDEENRLHIVRGQQPSHSILVYVRDEEGELRDIREETLQEG